MKPMNAPATMPATMPRTAPTMPSRPAAYATQAPNMAPKISWPWPPMLNRPDPQRQHDGEAGEHERRGLLQGAGQAVRHEERLPDQRLVRVPGADALVADQEPRRRRGR